MTDTASQRETDASKAETRRIARPVRSLAAKMDNANRAEMTGPDISRILRESK
jgi:hypothetical protein